MIRPLGLVGTHSNSIGRLMHQPSGQIASLMRKWGNVPQPQQNYFSLSSKTTFFFILELRTLWDVYPSILVDKELKQEELDTQLRAVVNPSELLPSSPIKTPFGASLLWQGWKQNVDVCFSVSCLLMDPLVHMLFF